MQVTSQTTQNAGADLYNSKDYDGAYRAWAIFNEIPQNPTLREKLTNVPADTILGEIAFNQALAAWQGNHFEDALNAFLFAKSKGYSKKQLYDYAIAVADGAKNREAVLALSEEALGLYGDQDPMYLGQVVNYYLQSKDFDKAFEIINQAIAKNPDNSQYYNIQGVLYENVEKRPEAIAAYKKATELDPKNAQALYNYGRQLCEEAFALGDTAPTKQDEYTAYFNEKSNLSSCRLPIFSKRHTTSTPTTPTCLSILRMYTTTSTTTPSSTMSRSA